MQDRNQTAVQNFQTALEVLWGKHERKEREEAERLAIKKDEELKTIARARAIAEARQVAVTRMDEALTQLHDGLAKCSQYLDSTMDSTSAANADCGPWRELSAGRHAPLRVRAARNREDPTEAVIEIADGKMLNMALYEQLVTEHAAQSVFECEQADLLQGIKPPRKRTYAEGFEYGQSWARSLTLTRLLRLWQWSEVVDRQDSENCNALDTWKAAYGKRYRNENDCCNEIDAFWESDGLDADTIHKVSSEYSNGFFDGAVGVAQRVASNVP